jgi:3-deoxy-D-manno-octulosonate 8-phosphate phosphatase (KDO 8-P phosphatase)
MGSNTSAALAARCQSIELLVADVDGVLTDGVITLDDQGVETKHFHVRDGMALTLWHRAGKQSAILSSRRAAAVEHRAAELKITHVLQGHEQKADPLRRLVSGLGFSPHQVCFVGDDLADLAVLRCVGLAACPGDAAPEVKEAAQLVTQAPGGRGAIREVVEIILKCQGRWSELIDAAFGPRAGRSERDPRRPGRRLSPSRTAGRSKTRAKV